MAYREAMLKHNQTFVETKKYEQYITTKFPERKVAILTCMDTRLIELLPAALNLKNGDVKIIKNSGGVISHPFGSAVRSLLICIYELGVEEIYVIGHHDCGMHNLKSEALTEKMKARGVRDKDLETIGYFGIDVDDWLKGFNDPAESVKETVKSLKKHPLIPKDVLCSGHLMDPVTGKLDVVE